MTTGTPTQGTHSNSNSCYNVRIAFSFTCSLEIMFCEFIYAFKGGFYSESIGVCHGRICRLLHIKYYLKRKSQIVRNWKVCELMFKEGFNLLRVKEGTPPHWKKEKKGTASRRKAHGKGPQKGKGSSWLSWLKGELLLDKEAPTEWSTLQCVFSGRWLEFSIKDLSGYC